MSTMWGVNYNSIFIYLAIIFKFRKKNIVHIFLNGFKEFDIQFANSASVCEKR